MIEASYTQTQSVLREATTEHLRARTLPVHTRIIGWLMMFGASLFIFLHGFQMMILVMLTVGFMMALGHYILAYLGAFQIRKDIEGKHFHFTFTEEGYEIVGPGSEGKNNWSNILEVMLSSSGIFLCPNQSSSIYIPRSGFKNKSDFYSVISLAEQKQVKIKKI